MKNSNSNSNSKTQRHKDKKTNTHTQIQKYTKYTITKNNQNAKSQIFRLRLPTFGGQSCLRYQMISRLPEVRFEV